MALCPHCANPVKRSYKFCQACGAKLKKRLLSPLLLGLFSGLSTVALLVWFLTYLILTDSPKEKASEPLTVENKDSAEGQTSDLEPVQAPEEVSAQHITTEESQIEIAETGSTKMGISQGTKTKKDPSLSTQSGEYETTKSTIVFSEPRTNSKRITILKPGIRLLVVRSDGKWLEIRSRHGRPPGYIHRDNIMRIESTN